MTDRELLELAANAAGMKKDDSPYNGGGHGNDGFDIMGNVVLDWHNNVRWNPLTDDGDALRLAVKLRIHIRHFPHDVEAQIGGEYQQEYDGTDPYAATRRAIVRAAAEIGRNMK